MAIEQFSNDASTTLSGAITDSATSLTVTSAAAFPTDGKFRIKIEDEILLVTDVAAAVFTVERGIEGTVAAAHADASDVDHILTAGSLGSAFGPRRGLVVPPAPASWTWVNQGTSTLTDLGDSLLLDNETGGSGENVRGIVMATPATPYTVTACFVWHMSNKTFQRAGMGLRETATGELILFGFDTSNFPVGFPGILGQKFNSPTSFNSGYTALEDMSPYISPMGSWFRISDDGTTRALEFSMDGVYWRTFASHLRTDFLTADQIGMVTDTFDGGTTRNVLTLLHWEVT